MSTGRESVETELAPHYEWQSDIGLFEDALGLAPFSVATGAASSRIDGERIEVISQNGGLKRGRATRRFGSRVEPSPWESGSNFSAEGGGGNIKRAATTAC